MIYHVLLMRDVSLLEMCPGHFKTVQDLQYLAGPINANSELEAADKARQELVKADKRDNLRTTYTVLGHINRGKYKPWLNGTFR